MKISFVISFLFSASYLFAQSCPPEDCLSGQQNHGVDHPIATGTITAISAPTKGMVLLDADDFAVGPVTTSAIKDKYPTSTFEGFTARTRNGQGTYNVNLSGNAFAWNASGELMIIPEGASFQETDTVIIHLTTPSTEFGVFIGDYFADCEASFYSENMLLGSVIFNPSYSPIQYFSSDTPFDEVRLSNPSELANWVITEFAVESVPPPIPTMGEWGLVLFGLVSICIGLGTMYSFRHTRVSSGNSLPE